MNPLHEFVSLWADAFDMVFEAFPWLIPAFLALVMLSIAVRMFSILFFVTPSCDPQDYDSICPPLAHSCDAPEPVHIPTNRAQYDPEHWYTGKD